MKRFTNVLLIAVLFSVMLVGLTSVIGAEELEGKIVYATNRTDIADTQLRVWADMFEEEHPKVEVEIESFKDYEKIIKTRLAAGQAPDVFLVASGNFPETSYPLYFEPLDDLGLKGNIYFEDSFTVDGNLYVIPYSLNKTGFIYNKRAFAEAGIKKIPSTLNEFYDTCEKLKDAGVIPLSPLAKDGWPTRRYSQFLAAVYKGSGDIYLPMLETKEPFNLNSPAGKGVNFLHSLKTKGYIEPDPFSTNWDGFKIDFARGKYGMVLLENWFISQAIDNGASPEDIGFFPIPVTGDFRTVVTPDWGYVVNKDSENINIAKEFVHFMMFDVYEEWINFTGGFPVRKDLEGIPDMAQIREFDSFEPEAIELGAIPDDWTKVANKARFAWENIGADTVAVDNLGNLFDGYNDDWADALESLK